MTDLALALRTERPGDEEAIARLHERAFGPGRFARSAFLLRERSPAVPELSFAALVGTLLVGSARTAAILAGDAPALVLGPLAVEPAFESRGIGAALMRNVLVGARERGHSLILLVGDPAYYERFGFRPVPAGRLTMPGPVDPGRFLACEFGAGVLERAAGRVRPGRASTGAGR